MPRRVLVVAGTVLAVGAVTLTLTAPTAAGDPAPPPSSTSGTTPPDLAPGMLQAMGRDLGLTPDQARTRIANEKRAAELSGTLGKKLGDRYAGSWVTGPTSKLVVATTDRAKARDISAAGARAKVVGRSVADLKKARTALDRAARERAPRSAGVWSVDVRANQVLLRSSKPAQARAFVQRSGADTGAVRVVRSAEQPRTYANLRGGDAFRINGTSRCSVGFPVTKGSEQGFVTAGHCGKLGDRTTGYNGAAQGAFAGSRFPGDDYSWVRTNQDWRATPYVKGPDGVNSPVSGAREMPAGSSVCRSGSTSGWHCGAIQELNATVSYPEGRVEGLTRTSVCAEPGDSGGPFLSGREAQGTTSGGSGDCTKGGTTYFQPVGEALDAFGLTLRTTG